MANDFLGEILGSVLSRAGASKQSTLGSASANRAGTGGLGDLLGGLMGGSSRPMGGGLGGGSSFGGKGALMAMLLPLAMQWVQRSGGIGGVLDQFRKKGYSQQAASWVSTGENEVLEPQAIDEVVGTDELSRLSRQLGVGNEEVASGMAQILPEMVNHLTPQGEVPHDADNTLNDGISTLERLMNQAKTS